MKNFISEYFKISIWSPQLDIFRVDESYDIRQVIINKKDKYDLKELSANDFPAFFFKIKKLCGCQYFANSVISAFGITFLIVFIVFIGIFTDSYQCYLSVFAAIWTMLGLSIFFILAYPFFFFGPMIAFNSYNKKYLSKLKSIFVQMQNAGYIEKDITKYPESLQMAFWEYRGYDWHRDLNHYLHHWKSWYGVASLKYFFWAYDNLQFPIDEKSKWNSWFNRFVSRGEMATRFIYLNSPHHDK